MPALMKRIYYFFATRKPKCPTQYDPDIFLKPYNSKPVKIWGGGSFYFALTWKITAWPHYKKELSIFKVKIPFNDTHTNSTRASIKAIQSANRIPHSQISNQISRWSQRYVVTLMIVENIIANADSSPLPPYDRIKSWIAGFSIADFGRASFFCLNAA
jgi:hypothetical protein